MSEAPVAILTGGAQGLGASISVVLLDKGYKVSCTCCSLIVIQQTLNYPTFDYSILSINKFSYSNLILVNKLPCT